MMIYLMSGIRVVVFIVKFEFEKIDIKDMCIIVTLSVTLIISLYLRMDTVSTSIISGLLGYIGVTRSVRHKDERRDNYDSSN